MPLAPIDQLAERRGEPEKGEKLFHTIATCSNCHIVRDQGKNVGPDLSEIGGKLSREAMFTSILDPSAGVSQDYANYIVLTVDGQVFNGLKVSESDQAITIRSADAIDHRIANDEIEQIRQSDESIMPADLYENIDQQGLIDIVEYLMTLKKH